MQSFLGKGVRFATSASLQVAQVDLEISRARLIPCGILVDLAGWIRFGYASVKRHRVVAWRALPRLRVIANLIVTGFRLR